MKSISAKKLKSLGGKMPFSTFKAAKKKLPKSNPRQSAKRKAGYRKMLSGKEYRSAKAEAMRRAGNRCEQYWDRAVWWLSGDMGTCSQRCDVTEDLHAHHLRYPKSRPLAGSDLKIVCRFHHEYLESLKPHKRRMAS